MDNNWFLISYATWREICKMYFLIPEETQKAYLQWFPFSKLTEKDKETIVSQVFFEKYIHYGGFVFFAPVMRHSDNFIQKGDGSFRNSKLISPILYLVLQSIGKEISNRYIPNRPRNIGVYFAGNYYLDRPEYKKDYDNFYKAINAGREKYQYFIKTDVSNFFSSINVNELVAQIESVCNKTKQTISQTQLLIVKELLLFCGDGYFPLVENSMASSYLATVVYLDKVDCKLYDFITSKVPDITEFQMIRYVDDLYILFSSDKERTDLIHVYNLIVREYSSIMKEYGLSLNMNKSAFKEMSSLNEELKKSLYDDYVSGAGCKVAELFNGSLTEFLVDIYERICQNEITNEQYIQLIDSHFGNDDIEFTASEVYNYLTYENQTELKSSRVSEILVNIIKTDVTFLSIDPKRLAVMIIQSGNNLAVKAMLNQLFQRFRAGVWNSYDTSIAIAYLIQSKFRHRDLLEVLKMCSPQLYDYYLDCCKMSFINLVCSEKENRYLRCIEGDSIASLLFFMSLCERNRSNNLIAYAYYKNFFDRISADMAHITGADGKARKVNYNNYYKKGVLGKLYAGLTNSDRIITSAQKARNENPLVHSSAETMLNDKSKEEYGEIIAQLDSLINQYSKQNQL